MLVFAQKVESKSGSSSRIVLPAEAVQTAKQLATSPEILNLGSEVQDGSVSLACSGKAPFSRLSCHVYTAWIARPSLEEYNKSRADLERDLAAQTDMQFRQQQQRMCSQVPTDSDMTVKTKRYSLGRAADARYAFGQLRSMCACATKECLAKVMLDEQTHEQNECTIYNSVIPVDFVRVNDRKWVSNNGPEGICGTVSVLTIEHEANDSILWTYTSHYSFTNTKDGLCQGLKDDDSTYSWKAPKSLRLRCDEFKFHTLPESR